LSEKKNTIKKKNLYYAAAGDSSGTETNTMTKQQVGWSLLMYEIMKQSCTVHSQLNCTVAFRLTGSIKRRKCV